MKQFYLLSILLVAFSHPSFAKKTHQARKTKFILVREKTKKITFKYKRVTPSIKQAKQPIPNEFGPINIDNLYASTSKQTEPDYWWDKHMNASFGSSNTIDHNASRTNIHFFKLDYHDKFGDFIDVGSQVLASSTTIKMVHKRNGNCDDCQDLPREITFSYSRDRLELFTFYVRANLSKYSDLTLGQDIVTWGQFEPFSPINTVFPVNLTPYSFDLTKQTTTLPQLHSKLSIYPSKRLKWDSYYFPKIQMHDILRRGKIDNNLDQYHKPALDSEGNLVNVLVPIEVDVPDNESSWGTRLMYYHDDFTLGFSYYDGWNVNQLSYFNSLENVTLNEMPVSYVKNRIGFAKQKAYGAELNIPYGDKWEFIAEVMLQTNQQKLRYFPEIFDNIDDYNRYTNWISRENNNRLYVDKKQLISGLGFAYKGSRLSSNFALFNLKDIYSKHAKTGVKLEKLNYTKKSRELPLYPVFDIGYYLDAQKEKEIGALAGILGYGYGGGIYFAHNITDDFKYKLSTRMIKYFFDDLIDDPKYKERYESKASVSKAIALEFIYYL